MIMNGRYPPGRAARIGQGNIIYFQPLFGSGTGSGTGFSMTYSIIRGDLRLCAGTRCYTYARV